MSFVYPWFLWALLALAIPVIIHLFHFRRFKTVYFTNVKFLKEVKEQTSARSKIKHLLVLIARILTLAFLVFAFAMPYLPNKNGKVKSGNKDVSIFFDNSFSMAAESEDVRLLEKARTRVEEIVSAYSVDDRIQILTADFEGRDQRLLSKEDALTRINEVKITHNVRNLSKVLARQKQAVNGGKNKNKELYIVSDFQKNITDLSPYKDTTISLNLVPLQSVQNQNVAIDTAWFQSPVQSLNQPNPLVVKVRNLSDREIPNVRMSLYIDNQTRPVGTLTIPAQTSVYDTIDIPVLRTGWHEAKLTITDFPIEFDNDYYFTFNVDEQVDILQIHEGTPNRFVAATFLDNDYFKATSQNAGQLNYTEFPNYDLVILDELKSIPSGLISELKNYAMNGGNVVLFPHHEANLSDYNNLTRQFNANAYGSLDVRERKVSYINFEEFIFNDVFEDRRSNLKLPVTQANYKIAKRATSGEEVILRYRDGGTFVGKYTQGKGHLFLCAAPLGVDYSDFVKNGEIFVPMLYKMALSATTEDKVAYIIGKDDVLETDNRASSSELVYKLQGNQGEFIPEQRPMGSRVMLGLNNQIKAAGFYNLYLKKDEVLDKFGFNYDRKESYLTFYNVEDLGNLMGSNVAIIEGTNSTDFTEIIATQSKGTPLWKWCLVIALIFLAIETALLRLWKI
ncbi:BatA domain-containing protein [Aureispira anguillae]|uniref:BatA domain-containing protein n=1 Tax=Aureispira anguillae TaxID=2864201 RepID=A0A915YF95_9BACT|nr:BatA domain-containing protein [Aureispira anguillae]BDS12065.1 BatA domain-containing protein [Aureispira anguillae]